MPECWQCEGSKDTVWIRRDAEGEFYANGVHIEPQREDHISKSFGGDFWVIYCPKCNGVIATQMMYVDMGVDEELQSVPRMWLDVDWKDPAHRMDK